MTKLNKIVLHWTAGGYFPNSTDLEHYHYLIDGNGNVINGKYKPEDNENCNDGKYAAHCGGGNTGSIGVALCGMLGYQGKTQLGKYPLKRIQFERAYELCADLCKKYGIFINRNTVFTHYEFGINHPDTSSRGKIDIDFVPYEPNLKPYQVGDYIRGKVIWYKAKK